MSKLPYETFRCPAGCSYVQRRQPVARAGNVSLGPGRLNQEAQQLDIVLAGDHVRDGLALVLVQRVRRHPAPLGGEGRA